MDRKINKQKQINTENKQRKIRVEKVCNLIAKTSLENPKKDNESWDEYQKRISNIMKK